MSARPTTMRKSDKPLHPLLVWRLHFGITQEHLADVIGVGRRFIGHIENHRVRVPRKRLARLCEFTGLPPEAFATPVTFLQECPDFLACALVRGEADTDE